MHLATLKAVSVTPRLAGEGAVVAAGVEVDGALARLLISGGVPAGAAHAGVSERTLRRIFARRGVRLADFLREARMLRVKQGFQAGKLDASLAFDLGFSSVQNLYRFIRREFGSGVRDLKRSLRGRNPEDLVRGAGGETARARRVTAGAAVVRQSIIHEEVTR